MGCSLRSADLVGIEARLEDERKGAVQLRHCLLHKPLKCGCVAGFLQRILVTLCLVAALLPTVSVS